MAEHPGRERRRGRQRTGTFPSYKMDKPVRYRSPYERMMYFLLELDVDVVGYEHEPFKITARFDDGEDHDYTPDIQAWCRKRRNRLYEIKGEDYVDDEHTHQQVDIGRAWCGENDHQFLLISSADLRADALQANAELLWDYRWRALPAPFIWECRDLVASLEDRALIAALRAHIALTYPSLPPLPAIYNMLFHHHLATDLRQPLGPERLLRCDDEEV